MRLATMARSCGNLSIIAAALALTASAAGAKDLVLTRSAVSGEKSVVAHERAWDNTCVGRPAVVTITRQPTHGTLVVEQGASVIPASTPRFGSTKQCAGRSVNGNIFVYRSQPGFHGNDHVSWKVVYDGSPVANTDMIIKVR